MSLTIHTDNLVKIYKSRTVVNKVSVSVKQGEIVGLLGPNGAGKTTTFYMVVGLIKPDEGTVFLNEEDITKLPMYKRAQMGIGYLPQEASVFRKLSVEDNIMAVLEMTKLNKQERLEKLETLLDEFNLHHVRKNNGDSLSGGERRRTEIARALAVDPKFILLDEPFAGVDPIAVEDIQTVVAKLKYKNIGILITDHNVNETLSICDRAYLLIEGKIFKHGTAEELAANEQVKRLYLGTNFELKRKDWIIELGMKNKKTPSLSSIIRSLESLEEHSDKILKANLGSLLSRKSLSTKLEDLKVDDFVSLYNSTKLFLVKWSNERSESDLKTLINQLPSLNESDFEQASFLLHGSHIESYGLDLDVAGIINYFNYERTDGKLQLLKSHLGLIKLRINALNNSN
jgi:lipopolysaccharide export system ATP-binding protein